VFLDGEDVTKEIRTAEVAQAASRLATIAGVRLVLVAEQQRAGAGGGVVMEGRDIGTVVFPRAELKIFLDASPEVRAERRWKEHREKGERLTLPEVFDEVIERDKRDRERKVSPLVRAADAVLVDNTAMGIEETARLIVMLAREQIHERIVQIARDHRVAQGRRMRVDTTVVETNIHYPTDSSLLGDGVRVLTRTMKKITGIAGAAGTHCAIAAAASMAGPGDRAGGPRQRSTKRREAGAGLPQITGGNRPGGGTGKTLRHGDRRRRQAGG